MTSPQRTLLRAVMLCAVSGTGVLLHAQHAPPQPDAACMARCVSARDGRLANAATKLKANDYFSKFTTNCPTPDGAPNCAAARQACYDACGPKFENICMAACEAPFQSCCHGNETMLATRLFEACIAECPPAKAGPVADVDRKAEMSRLVDGLGRMMQSLGPAIDGFDAARFDDLRRAMVFMEVSADIAETDARFAVVPGGAGRLWIILAGGRHVLLDAGLAAALRGEADDDVEVTKKAFADATGLSGLDAFDVHKAISVASAGRVFGPGVALYFPKVGGWPKNLSRRFISSSEHGSVRGTINGTGDFI